MRIGIGWKLHLMTVSALLGILTVSGIGLRVLSDTIE